MNVSVQPAHRDVMDPHICIVSSAKSNFVDIIEVDNMNASLLVLFIFITVYLK
jgi:hypothetical protein